RAESSRREIRCCGVSRIIKIHPVKHIEELRPELESDALRRKRKLFKQPGIEIHIIRAPETALPDVAETPNRRKRKARGIQIIHARRRKPAGIAAIGIDACETDPIFAQPGLRLILPREHRERTAGHRADDPGPQPAAERIAKQRIVAVQLWQIPNVGDDDALWMVVIGRSVVVVMAAREIPWQLRLASLRRGNNTGSGRRIVKRPRPGVIRQNRYPASEALLQRDLGRMEDGIDILG